MLMNITITDKAATHIKILMEQASDNVTGMRLGVKTTGCSGNSYKMDYVEKTEDKPVDMSGDDLIKSNGAEIYIPKIYSWMLIGTEIDYITDNLGNSRFEFTNPNETSRCGCGESFQVERKEE